MHVVLGLNTVPTCDEQYAFLMLHTLSFMSFISNLYYGVAEKNLTIIKPPAQHVGAYLLVYTHKNNNKQTNA